MVGDGVCWRLAEDGAVNDGSAGIFCWAGCELVGFEEEELVTFGWIELMPWRVAALTSVSVATVVCCRAH